MFLIENVGYDNGSSNRNWRWPGERKHIYDVFENFSNWVTTPSAYPNWYREQPHAGYYDKRPR